MDEAVASDVAVILAVIGPPRVMAVLVIALTPDGEATVVLVDAAAEGAAEIPCGAAIDLPGKARAFLAVAAVDVPENARDVIRDRAPRSMSAAAEPSLLRTAAFTAVTLGIVARREVA